MNNINKPQGANKSVHVHVHWDEYFMLMAHMVKTRSTCIRRAVGAVLVRNNHVVATGYNGAPSGLAHASEVGCLRNREGIPSGEQLDICRGSHGEMNAIAHCARYGIATDGSTLYSTTKPCSMCVKVIINAGITRVVYNEPYNDPMADKIIDEVRNRIEFVEMSLDAPEHVQIVGMLQKMVGGGQG